MLVSIGSSYAQTMNNTTISQDLKGVPPSVMNRFQGKVQEGDGNVPTTVNRISPANSNSIPTMIHTQRTKNPSQAQTSPQNPDNGTNSAPIKVSDCNKNSKPITPEEMNVKSSQYNTELSSFASGNNLIGVTLDEKDNLPKGIVSVQFIYSKLPESLKCHTIRVIEPNSVVTMDYSPNRINVQIDANKKITKLVIG